MIYFVDIDNTICHTNGNDYRNSDPWPDKIALINDLFDQGHRIVYWTSRGSSSGRDWEPFTIMQLKRWGCKFDEVRMGKPSYDFIIDDKMMEL
jgi:CMP-N,N'-diacetyllegionaminic acid synthase